MSPSAAAVPGRTTENKIVHEIITSWDLQKLAINISQDI
jgi:hypothetical protein